MIRRAGGRRGIDPGRAFVAGIGCLAAIVALLSASRPIAPGIPVVATVYAVGLVAGSFEAVHEHPRFRAVRAVWSAGFATLLALVVPYAALVALFVDSASLTPQFLALIVMALVPPLLEGSELLRGRSALLASAR